MATRPLEGALQDKRDFRFDLRVNQLADLDLAGFDAPHETTVVVQRRIVGGLGPAHVLNREAEAFGLLGVGGGGRFEDVDQRRAVIPIEAFAAVDDHVAIEG